MATPLTIRTSRKAALCAFAALVSLATVVGCGALGKYQSSFSLAVVNKTANTIQVLANGAVIGQVTAGDTGAFTIQLTESNPNTFTNGVAPSPQATATLSAKDLRSGALSTTKSVTLSQDAPTYVTFAAADFPSTVPTRAQMSISPTAPGLNQDVFFNGASSTGSGLTYLWDFGDGQRGEGSTATHQYRQAGNYTVSLTVTADNGTSSTLSRTLAVSANLPPQVANFTFSPTIPAINQDVAFTAASNARDAVPGAVFSWNFGDGTAGAGTPVTHKYARAGTYTVTMTVTNTGGQSATTSRTITVSASLPAGSVSFVFSPTSPAMNTDVFFNASASTVVNGTYTWNFGDGTTGAGITTTHRFTRPGTFTIVLTATNDFRQTASISRTITVTSSLPAGTVDFTISPTAPGLDDDVFFNAAASTVANATYRWDFGDGGSGSGLTARHTYAWAATFTVVLTVTNDVGQSASASKSVTVSGNSRNFIADFTFSPTDPSITNGTNSVIFDATPSSSSADSYAWDFGDGSTGSGRTENHTFSKPGTWVVRLTISGSVGRTATTTKNVTVAQ